MKTEKRIEKLAESVAWLFDNFDRKIVVADIATDHGYLAEKISKYPNIEKIYATDISKKSLSKIEKLKREKNLDKIETFVGDGLEPIDGADIAVIAGIGGYEISKMLENQNKTFDGKHKCRYFVLQPAQNDVWLRGWLYKNKVKILNDRVVQDGNQFYPIITVDCENKQRNRMSVKNLWLGTRCDLNDSDFVSFLIEKQNALEFIKDLPQKRFKKDEILRQKRKLSKIIAKMLKNIKLKT